MFEICLVFFVVAFIATIFGFSSIAAMAMLMGEIALLVLLALLLMSFVLTNLNENSGVSSREANKKR